MAGETTPIVILGGSDRKPARLPERGRDKHPISGYKGVDIRMGGQPLVETIIERLRASGKFGPIYIAGPADIYEAARTSATIIDAGGSFGQNIETSMEFVRVANPGRTVAFTTCDILPEVETLQEMAEHYEAHAPCDMWFPLIRAPRKVEQLGASSWKPSYRVVPSAGEPAVDILPGHLAYADPEALRLKFIYKLFEVGYRTRNRPIDQRRKSIVRSVIFELLYQDLRHIFGLRVPSLTWSVMRAGIPVATQLKQGIVTRERLEKSLRTLFVKYRHRRRYPERRIVLPIVEGISLALDIDTEEEAREMGAEIDPKSRAG